MKRNPGRIVVWRLELSQKPGKRQRVVYWAKSVEDALKWARKARRRWRGATKWRVWIGHYGDITSGDRT